MERIERKAERRQESRTFWGEKGELEMETSLQAFQSCVQKSSDCAELLELQSAGTCCRSAPVPKSAAA